MTTPSTFIIAEAGVNHNGSLALAKKLIDTAVKAGVDAVKFQTFKAESLTSKEAPLATYQKKNVRGAKSQQDMLKKLELSFDAFRRLKDYCDKKKILFLSTPFDEECAAFLVKDLNMALIKVPSGEVTNLPYLCTLASFGKPVILSTGMCDMEEVGQAIGVFKQAGLGQKLSLLHCTSAYPCTYEDVNLRAMNTLAEAFQLPIGYSDHTLGIEVSIAAVALGARIIEKHFTLDRRMAGPDHKASLELPELTAMVRSIRHVEQAFGSSEKKPTDAEKKMRVFARKSLHLNRDMDSGSILSHQDLIARRPGTGISPADLESILGQRLKTPKKEGHPIQWKDLQTRGNR